MSGELRNYDPALVTATFSVDGQGSIDLTSGLIDGEGAISVVRAAPNWSAPRADRNGNAGRNKSKNKTGLATFVYVAEAEIQTRLTALVAVDDQTGAVVGSIVIKDLNGDTICTYIGAYIQSTPSPVYGMSAADRVYVWGFAEAIELMGGAEAR